MSAPPPPTRRRTPPSPEPLSALAARLTEGGEQGPGRAISARWDRLRAALEPKAIRRAPSVHAPATDERIRRRRWTLAGGAVVMAAAAVLLGLRLWPGPRVTFAVAGGVLGGDGYISVAADAPSALTFSEGTRVDMAPGSRAWVVSTDRRGARVRLEEGRARFAVVHRPRARWTVDAGPFTVEVTGTMFDVRWSGGEDLFEVRLIVGGVDIHGPLTGAGVRLHAGETFVARVNQGMVQIARASTTAAASPPVAPLPPPSPVAATPPVKDDDAPPTLDPAPLPPPAPPRRPAPGRALAPAINVGGTWRQRVASGDFRSVLDEAEERGIDTCLRRLPEDRLATLADAARYAGQPALAERVLLATRQRFAGSTSARRAAFLLGRLADDGGAAPAAVLRWYETYLDEAPTGSYADEALGRRMLVIQRRDGTAAARGAADEYLRRFPTGAFAGPARAITSAASP